MAKNSVASGVETSQHFCTDENAEVFVDTDDATSSGGTTRFSEEKDRKILAAKESRQVFRIRVMGGIVLMVVASVVCVGVYLLSSQAVLKEFEASFDGSAQKVLGSFHSVVTDKITAVGLFGAIATAHGEFVVESQRQQQQENTNAFLVEQNTTTSIWPEIVLPSFHETATSVRALSNVLHFEMLPLVRDASKLSYELYVQQNYERTAMNLTRPSPSLVTGDGEHDFYFPVWQVRFKLLMLMLC